MGILGLSGCVQDTQPTQSGTLSPSATVSQSADLLSQLQEKGEIVVAMEGAWSPWTYHDKTDTLAILMRKGNETATGGPGAPHPITL